jgi:hypothetical protein
LNQKNELKMPNFIYAGLLPLLLCFIFNETYAQLKEYTDHKPVYRKWKENYAIDKIAHTKSSTIIHFRFACRSGQYINAIFYEPGNEAAWYLKGKNGKDYTLKALKNIRRNNELLLSNLTFQRDFPSLEGSGFTVFSCEAHFRRLPKSEKVVDFIEGKGFEAEENHFNCFDIVIKGWNDKNLGDIQDSKEKIEKFQNKFSSSKN